VRSLRWAVVRANNDWFNVDRIERAVIRASALASVGLITCALSVRNAIAAPQLSTSLTVGGGIREGQLSPRAFTTGQASVVSRETLRAAFHMGVWADATFFRRRASDMGLGPYVQLTTTGFKCVDAGLGATWVIPTRSAALAVSAGGHLRGASTPPQSGEFPAAWTWTPGVSAAIFLGSKSYNFHGPYAMTIGGVLQGKYGITSAAARGHAELTLALQVDFEVIALPFVLLGEALRGPSQR
jgi:hypothetical protein